MIEICTVGGYNEVGKNMTAIKIDDDVFIIDMGLLLEEYIKYTEDEDIVDLSSSTLRKIGAIPDTEAIKDWKKNVKAIVTTHAHLDHIGAIPFLASEYENAPVIATPFTIAVLSTILEDETHRVKKPKNQLVSLSPNSSYNVGNIKVEFIHMTHSIPQTVMIALHTKYGVIIYANDFKLDNNPTLGKKPNYKRLQELAKENVLALIMDSTYSRDATRTPSESIAKKMLEEVLLETDLSSSGVVITTFSSHIARLKSIVEFGKKMKRKIIFLGRSLAKYTEAAEKLNIVNFSKDVEIVKYGEKIKKKLRKLLKQEKTKYLFVVTGHQGEKKAVLNKMVTKVLPFNFNQNDCVVFSCKTIPTKTNIQNRQQLENKLIAKKLRIFKDIHVSGHASREDQRELISMIKPANIIPAHGEQSMEKALVELAEEMGYKADKTVHLMKNGERLRLM